MFRHEHLVRINDPAIPADDWLSRPQLWTGLWQTVVAPFGCDPTLDDCRVQTHGDRYVTRELVRGGAVVRDRVESNEFEWLRIRLDPEGPHAGSSLEIRIEEPAPGALFVRFVYELEGPVAAQVGDDEAGALRAAYEAADVDRVRQARVHAARAPRA
jgi:hypothetical protein